MATLKTNKRSSKAPRRVFCVAAEDADAARRVLALLTEAHEENKQPTPPGDDRGPLLGRARFSLALKERRLELFGGDLSAEPAFDMLLALYVSEGADTIVTVSKLAELALVPLTTVLRWLDPLASKGWVDRSAVAGDARKFQLTLTAKGRDALDQLFSCSAESCEDAESLIPPYRGRYKKRMV